jgi:surface antigen
MSLYRKGLIPTIAGWMLAGAAQARLLPTRESHITPTQQDMEMFHNAVTNQIHGKPVGTAASWTNPVSQNSGSIRIVKELVRKRQPCEDIDYTVRSGAPVYTEHYHLTSCLQPDGTWKLA